MSALTPVYWLIAIVFLAACLRCARDLGNPRRHASAAFWGLLALVFAAGDWLPPTVSGAIVVALALIAGFGGVGRGTRATLAPAQREATAHRLGNRLFLPALLIPLCTVAFLFALKALVRDGKPMLQPQHATLIALALACLAGLGAACATVREGPRQALEESRGLLEAIGWAAVLPLVLATLGAVFAKTGVGDAIAWLVTQVVPVDSRFACVLAYALGMAAFTMIMGNAFAAFPVMTVGIALPLLVARHGAEPASLAALGMLSGYCGTLMTPMAANFNIVPAALLELRDQYAVIRAQVATALPLLAANVALMYFIVFR